MAQAKNGKTVAVTFEYERDTKNKRRFSETGVKDPKDAVIGKLYISNAAYESLGDPQNLVVHVVAE